MLIFCWKSASADYICLVWLCFVLGLILGTTTDYHDIKLCFNFAAEVEIETNASGHSINEEKIWLQSMLFMLEIDFHVDILKTFCKVAVACLFLLNQRLLEWLKWWNDLGDRRMRNYWIETSWTIDYYNIKTCLIFAADVEIETMLAIRWGAVMNRQTFWESWVGALGVVRYKIVKDGNLSGVQVYNESRQLPLGDALEFNWLEIVGIDSYCLERTLFEKLKFVDCNVFRRHSENLSKAINFSFFLTSFNAILVHNIVDWLRVE